MTASSGALYDDYRSDLILVMFDVNQTSIDSKFGELLRQLATSRPTQLRIVLNKAQHTQSETVMRVRTCPSTLLKLATQSRTRVLIVVTICMILTCYHHLSSFVALSSCAGIWPIDLQPGASAATCHERLLQSESLCLQLWRHSPSP